MPQPLTNLTRETDNYLLLLNKGNVEQLLTGTFEIGRIKEKNCTFQFNERSSEAKYRIFCTYAQYNSLVWSDS